MKGLTKYLLPLASILLLGQTPSHKPEQIIEPLPQDVIERCNKKLDEQDVAPTKIYKFYNGKTITGQYGYSTRSDRSYPPETRIDLWSNNQNVPDSEFIDIGVRDEIWGIGDGIPDAVVVLPYTFKVSSWKFFYDMDPKEQKQITERFQHLVSYIADSTDVTKEDSVEVK